MRTTLITAALLASFAGAAPAQTITASDPDTILSYFQGEGFPAKLEQDSYGDPLISVRYFGTNFSVYFYGCQQGRDCTSIQFFSGYRMDGEFTVDQSNVWNREHRFGRAYVSEEGSARLEHDVNLAPDGVPASVFDDTVSAWLQSLTEFEDVIDW